MNHVFVADYLANRKNPVQLVKHMDEVPESKITWPLLGQEKYDGIYCLCVVISGEPVLYSRVGKRLFFNETTLAIINNGAITSLPDGCYIGELCNPVLTLEQLAGLTSPNRKALWDDGDSGYMDESYIMFHDFLYLDELLDGYGGADYSTRLQTLRTIMHSSDMPVPTYCIPIEIIYSRDEAEKFADDLIAQGKEGAVFKQNADWEAGHKGWRAMKIVRGVSLDLLCVGVEYGKGKRTGQIAKLRFKYKGSEFNADLGKGWTDDRRIDLTNSYTAHAEHGVPLEHCELYPIGKIWEVKALQISSTGNALRLPKVVRVREDKDTPDA